MSHGIPDGRHMRVEFLPICTAGLPVHMQLWVWLTVSRRFRLTHDWEYPLPDGRTGVLLTGFDSDGSSIPKIFRWLLDPFGLGLIPGATHDWTNRFKCILLKDGTEIPVETRGDADNWYRRIYIQVNDMIPFALGTFIVLRGFGRFAWNNHRKNDGTATNDYKALRGHDHD